MLRFRLSGIPFEVEPSFWIFSAILGSNAAHGQNWLLLLAVWVACVFVSIVVHELGHAATARRFGASPRVRLYTMGGLTYPGQGFPRGQDLLVVLGGPAAGLTLYLLVRAVVYFSVTSVPAADDFLAGDGPANIATANALANLSFINLTWTLFNLLPILPLDGGLILRNLLGFERTALARGISVVVAVGCAAYAYLHGWTYGALFFGFFAFQNFQGAASMPGSGRR